MKVLYKGIFILFILVYLVGKDCCFIWDGKELLVNSGILIGKLFFFVYMILYDNMLLFIYGLFILKISLFIMIFFCECVLKIFYVYFYDVLVWF